MLLFQQRNAHYHTSFLNSSYVTDSSFFFTFLLTHWRKHPGISNPSQLSSTYTRLHNHPSNILDCSYNHYDSLSKGYQGLQNHSGNMCDPWFVAILLFIIMHSLPLVIESKSRRQKDNRASQLTESSVCFHWYLPDYIFGYVSNKAVKWAYR